MGEDQQNVTGEGVWNSFNLHAQALTASDRDLHDDETKETELRQVCSINALRDPHAVRLH